MFRDPRHIILKYPFPNSFFHYRYYSEPVVPCVRDLLHLVNPYLRLLLLNTIASDWRGLHSHMFETLDRFTDLEEFGCVGIAADIRVWSE
jgi:hypothetical protein